MNEAPIVINCIQTMQKSITILHNTCICGRKLFTYTYDIYTYVVSNVSTSGQADMLFINLTISKKYPYTVACVAMHKPYSVSAYHCNGQKNAITAVRYN